MKDDDHLILFLIFIVFLLLVLVLFVPGVTGKKEMDDLQGLELRVEELEKKYELHPPQG